MENSSRFFQNRECEFFPCHEVENVEEFNCLFCYCPLYLMNEACEGDYIFTKKGIKNCVNCTIPHQTDSADYIKKKLRKFIKGEE